MIFVALLLAFAQDGNRLTYLDELDPYYVHAKFPKLLTPQWIGEPGVEAVITLGIDDMRDLAKYEAFLRPILDRLKKIDGRAPVSIMSCTVDPNHPQLQKWLKEGLSIEVHTVDHPCPLLKDGDFAKAKSTVDRCIDLMTLIPNTRPVAYRMPCCDSLNTLSPRFFAEIFNKTTPHGKFLTIDTSVFNITTSADPDLPKELTTDPDGKERFRKYVPFPSFVNTIENYPYPYVIGGLCWEFPCAVPSDWEAQYVNKPNSPKSVEDMKAAIDAVVIKKGVFNFVFHPHGWIKSEQVVELIDHVVAKHGNKVKFLTFR
ncbi:MAG: dehydrogenase, partial [Planctomycetota bacterium]